MCPNLETKAQKIFIMTCNETCYSMEERARVNEQQGAFPYLISDTAPAEPDRTGLIVGKDRT